MNKLLLLFHTIKYLKFSQIVYRVVKRFHKPKVNAVWAGEVVERNRDWRHVLLHSSKLDHDLHARFLNVTKSLNLPKDWDLENPSKLWVYNLHYFEDLLATDAPSKTEFHQALLERWCKENPIGKGNGWEPYPISLRVANICMAWLGGLELEHTVLKSVFDQASYLSNDLEKHLLGNHYFVNLKALLFVGVIFKNKEWLTTAQKGLLSEIQEQILADGGNFELSPMYHNLILVDMLDMYNLSKTYPRHVGEELCTLIERLIPSMLNYMEAMSHPDEGVSFFNDSSNGIAPKKQLIMSYASQLGFKGNKSCQNSHLENLSYTGYLVAKSSDAKLIFDAANVGPDYIPGHAHADTLSFEMSIGKERVFVNSGTSEYGLSSERLRQRKTLAHNTIEIDGRDSSQVWSGFRVAKRARIGHRSAVQNGAGNIVLEASHDGYKSLFGGCVHGRKIELKANKVRLIDEIKGNFDTAVSRLHLHPDLSVSLNDGLLKIVGKNFEMVSDLSSYEATLEDTTWHPEFGITVPNKVINIAINQPTTDLQFTWK